ncbi:4643_t:CDS:2, partial [Funneliformis geosporum]
RVNEKEQVIKRTNQELSELKAKYSKKVQQLDAEQVENNKLSERIEKLEKEIEQLRRDNEKVKQLSLRNREERYRTNQFREYSQPRDQTFGSLDLEGELDFNGFTGLNVLVIEGQNNLTKLK